MKGTAKSKFEKIEMQLETAHQRLKEAYGMFAPGSGFGDPDAARQAQIEIESARFEYDRLKEERLSIITDRLQRHQVLTAWLAVIVAVIAAIPGVIALFIR